MKTVIQTSDYAYARDKNTVVSFGLGEYIKKQVRKLFEGLSLLFVKLERGFSSYVPLFKMNYLHYFAGNPNSVFDKNKYNNLYPTGSRPRLIEQLNSTAKVHKL